jgi:hypothetical protein
MIHIEIASFIEPVVSRSRGRNGEVIVDIRKARQIRSEHGC